MTEPLRGRKITIGDAERTLLFTMTAHRIAKKRLGRPIREVLVGLRDLDIDVICELASAGFTEGRGASREIVTPERVARWLDEEPLKTALLARAIAEAVSESFTRMFMGEANAADADAKKREAESAAMISSMTTMAANDAVASTPSEAGPTSDG